MLTPKVFLELCGLVITEPVLDVLGRSPDFLLQERLRAADIVLLAVIFELLPPALLWSLGWRLGSPVGGGIGPSTRCW